jgi:hypothetical protein
VSRHRNHRADYAKGRLRDSRGRFTSKPTRLEAQTLRWLSALRIRLEPPSERPLTMISTLHYALVFNDWWQAPIIPKEPE